MKPFKRPDSAKSAATKVTTHSDGISKDLSNSKFSQTFTYGAKATEDTNNDFQKYVAQKNKDPRFKKYLEPNMPQIPEKTVKKQSVPKSSTKPFEKKISKMEKTKKIEEEVKKQVSKVNEESMNSSLKFVDKNKKKMNNLKVSQTNNESTTLNEQKSKLNFSGFTVNMPGKKLKQVSARKQSVPQQKIIPQRKTETKLSESRKKNQQVKQSRTKEQKQRKQRQLQLSRFIQQLQTKNADLLPQNYEQFIEKNSSNVDIQKINLADFMNQPNQRDYQNIMRRIQQNDQRIQDGSVSKVNTSDIDLDELIESQETNQNRQSQLALSSMSAEQLHKRNLFLTEILKGKVTEEQIKQLEQMQKSTIKLMQLEQDKIARNQQDDDDLSEMTEINMKKRKSNRILQRNKIQASGKVYRDCDYLTQQQKQRLEDLLNDKIDQNPFQQSQQQKQRNQLLTQQIQMYRNLYNQEETNDPIIYQDSLPKDPILRKQAELKILKDKINSVNSRLMQTEKIPINKAKIQSIVEKFRGTKISRNTQQFLQNKRKEMQQQQKLQQEALQIINRVSNNRESIENDLEAMQARFKQLQREIIQIHQMDEEDYRQFQLKQLKYHRESLGPIEQMTFQIQQEISIFQEQRRQLTQKLKLLDEIMSIQTKQLNYQNYDPNENIESLNEMITKKWQEAQQATKRIQYIQDQTIQQNGYH